LLEAALGRLVRQKVPPNGRMSLELEVIDQLDTGRMKLQVLREIFQSNDHFGKAILGLVECGDIELFDKSGTRIPTWKCRELFADWGAALSLDDVYADATEQGIEKLS
jgi:hypothetical protein